VYIREYIDVLPIPLFVTQFLLIFSANTKSVISSTKTRGKRVNLILNSLSYFIIPYYRFGCFWSKLFWWFSL